MTLFNRARHPLSHLSLAIACALSFQAVAGEKTIKPTFLWPANLSATVSLNDRSFIRSDGQKFEEVTKGSYQMFTKTNKDGLEITYSNVSLKAENKQRPADLSDPVQQTVNLISSQYPNFLVSKQGKFIRNTNNRAIQNNVEQVLLEFKPHVKKGNMAEFDSMAQTSLSNERLTYMSSTFWHLAVGQWLHGDYSNEYVSEVNYDQSMPMLGGLNIPMKAEYSIKGRVPCTRAGITRRCLRLVMEAGVNKARLKEIISTIQRETGTAFPFKITSSKSKYVVVTEAETLIPHSTKITSSLNVTIDGAHPFRRQQSSSLTFKYP